MEITGKGARPYSQFGVEELEAIVSRPGAGRSVLEGVLDELDHRKTQRADKLRSSLRSRLHEQPEDDVADFSAAQEVPADGMGDLFGERPTRASLPDSSLDMLPNHSPRSNEPASPKRPVSLSPRPITDRMEDVLAAWTVLEVLSPSTYVRPADLAGYETSRIARIDRGLPWADGPARSRPGSHLFFQIVLGAVEMPQAMDRLLRRFADDRPERQQARGKTPLAVVIVDRFGRPIPDACAVVSSFAWGLPKALQEDPICLARWTEAEEGLQQALHDRLYRESERKGVLPLTGAAIISAFEWLVAECGLDRDLVVPPDFAVRSFVPMRSSEPPEAILLNSFYLRDLGQARALACKGAASETLRRYLGDLPPGVRRDLLNDLDAVEEVAAPGKFPLARWPGRRRHPLVLMQQAAVNLASRQGEGEILAVNGPPGTGKTTLLRDVIASLVTQRADVMASFDDPETAFSSSGQRLRLGAGFVHLYRVDPRLKGFEMLIASSNNKAVENVSAELPGIGAIASDAASLRYFEPMADEMLGSKAWGAIAAVLGNAGNRAAFRDRFWWNKDTGLFGYLKAVCGASVEVDLPEGGSREPRIVTEMDPPRDHREALRRWNSARTRFVQLRTKVESQRDEVEALRVRSRFLPRLSEALRACNAHAAERPGLLSRLFGTAAWRAWKARHLELSSRFADAGRAIGKTGILSVDGRDLSASPWLAWHGGADRSGRLSGEIDRAMDRLRHEQSARGAPILDDAFFDLPRDDAQKSAPWFTLAEQRDRDALFEAALELHRAFIDAAARPLRQNLSAALQVIDGKSLGDPLKDGMIPDLWSSLFLVVPAISTTFASVATMLRRVPPETLGWLLVDEAGQATPQQAVGALMRVRRAIVVGDPVQVEPVVLLPETLTNAICRSFGVSADRFAAPAASVQTLADESTSWFAEFPARAGTRIVGVPLLVHRRCAEPMFQVANRVAYEGLMVQAKAPESSPIRDLLGPARWVDIRGGGEDKWCEAEGRAAVEMLEAIAKAGLKLDIYLVTPFVVVAEGLRRMIGESPVLRAAIPELQAWARGRVGTIHTVQGREAEAVIFVLGAPNADQTGARGWAGKTPNLLNVAMTRAKEVAYVIGNRSLWQSAGVFGDLDRLIA